MFMFGIRVCASWLGSGLDAGLGLRFEVKVWIQVRELSLGFRFKILVWDSGLRFRFIFRCGIRFGIQVWVSSFGFNFVI